MRSTCARAWSRSARGAGDARPLGRFAQCVQSLPGRAQQVHVFLRPLFPRPKARLRANPFFTFSDCPSVSTAHSPGSDARNAGRAAGFSPFSSDDAVRSCAMYSRRLISLAGDLRISAPAGSTGRKEISRRSAAAKRAGGSVRSISTNQWPQAGEPASGAGAGVSSEVIMNCRSNASLRTRVS